MEVPAYYMDRSMEQEHALLTAIKHVLDKGWHDIDDPHELAADIIKALHEIGFMIVKHERREITKNQ